LSIISTPFVDMYYAAVESFGWLGLKPKNPEKAFRKQSGPGKTVPSPIHARQQECIRPHELPALTTTQISGGR
jgi:hypothetical protein